MKSPGSHLVPKRGFRFGVSDRLAESLELSRHARRVAVGRWECSPREARLLLSEIQVHIESLGGSDAVARGPNKGLGVLKRSLEAVLAGRAFE